MYLGGGRGGGIIRKMKCPERWCKKRACDIGIHPQVETPAEKEGKAGVPRHAETDGKITG